jgi:exosortase A
MSSSMPRLALGAVLIAAAWLYWPVVAGLVRDWSNDDNYSHGFLIVPIAAFFVWERRAQLKAAVPRPSLLGLGLAIASLALLVAGLLGAELFLTRVSLIGLAGGGILFLFGWNHFRILLFPLAFLILMVPIPAILFNQIAFPLQLVASRFGEVVVRLFDIPVLREGNVITLANTQLEVAEACSGIRSLISLLTLGIVYGYFMDKRTWVRVLVALCTIPVAIVANGLRVAGTGIAAHYYGSEAAQGFFHTFSGWIVFLAAFVMLFVVQRLVHLAAPKQPMAGVTEGAA